MDTFEELYQDGVKDIYSAEKQLLKAMEKALKKAESPELQEAIRTHIEQSKTQVDRLTQVATSGGFKPSGVVCLAAKGLVEETDEHLKEGGKPSPILDAAIISCLQKSEHYEIATYGTLVAWAKELGQKEAAALLKESLAEEVQTDKLLTAAAKEGINRRAEQKEPATAGKK